MDDAETIQRFFDRKHADRPAAAGKNGPSCRTDVRNIQDDVRGVAWCLNDARLSAWNAMSPAPAAWCGLTRGAASFALHRMRREPRDHTLCYGACDWAVYAGTGVDSLKYNAQKGCFYEFGGIGSEPLREETVTDLNEIFGIN